MKIKQVYISDENFNELKNVNASALVNELLTKHFEIKKMKLPKLSIPQLLELKDVLIKKQELEKQEEKITNG